MTQETPQLVLPKHIASLATSGILVGVEISAWTGNKQDRAISDEVAANKKASTEAGRYVKHLLAGDPVHRRLLNHRQTVYNWLRRLTYPWSDSLHYLPSLNIPKFMQEFRTLEKEYTTDTPDTLLSQFLNVYPTLVSNAAFSQGDMFNRDDYPTVDQIKAKFHINLYTAEVPLQDFRCQIAVDLAEDLKNHFTRQTEAIVDKILSTQAKQLIDVMESLSHCCENEIVTDTTGAQKVKRRKIYDTTLQKALEYCDTFRDFNLNENPHLERARSRLASLLDGVPLEALRESDSVRAQVKAEVDDILSKFRPVAPTFDDSDE